LKRGGNLKSKRALLPKKEKKRTKEKNTVFGREKCSGELREFEEGEHPKRSNYSLVLYRNLAKGGFALGDRDFDLDRIFQRDLKEKINPGLAIKSIPGLD